MKIKEMNYKTRQSLEQAIKESNIKTVVVCSEEPFIELWNGTIIWLDEIGGWKNEKQDN